MNTTPDGVPVKDESRVTTPAGPTGHPRSGSGIPPSPAAHPTFPGAQLQPWPFWTQTNDPAMDGDPGNGPNALLDCGPESVSMCLDHLTDIQIDADYIWDCIQQLHLDKGQPTGPAYTSIDDLQNFLNTFCSIDTVLLQVDPALPFSDPAVQRFLHAIRSALTTGHPLIGLFSFSAPNADDGHFRPIIGDTGHYLLTADPAKGFIPPHGPRVEGYRLFWSWSKGFALELKRRRSVLF